MPEDQGIHKEGEEVEGCMCPTCVAKFSKPKEEDKPSMVEQPQKPEKKDDKAAPIEYALQSMACSKIHEAKAMERIAIAMERIATALESKPCSCSKPVTPPPSGQATLPAPVSVPTQSPLSPEMAIAQKVETSNNKAIEFAKSMFPKELETLLTFVVEGGDIIIRPRQYLGSENFAKIITICKGANGDYVSAGKQSHFKIPIPKQT